MKAPLATLASAALALAALGAPTGAAAQDGGWWSPLAERLPANGEQPGVICTLAPELPACGGETARDRTPVPDRDDRTRWPDGRTREDDDRRERRAEARRGGRGNGPPFCRNGQGHPVHGRAWCRDKGFGNDGTWRDMGWEDVIFGRQDRTRDRQRLDRGGLIDVLGDVVLGRLDRQARSLGGGDLTGRFVEGRTRVLQVRAGDIPLAELLDADRDGRVDRILLRTLR